MSVVVQTWGVQCYGVVRDECVVVMGDRIMLWRQCGGGGGRVKEWWDDDKDVR